MVFKRFKNRKLSNAKKKKMKIFQKSVVVMKKVVLLQPIKAQVVKLVDTLL